MEHTAAMVAAGQHGPPMIRIEGPPLRRDCSLWQRATREAVAEWIGLWARKECLDGLHTPLLEVPNCLVMGSLLRPRVRER